MGFSGLETLIFTLDFGNNWVLCQISWVSIPKFLKIIEYLPKTYGILLGYSPYLLRSVDKGLSHWTGTFGTFTNSADPD